MDETMLPAKKTYSKLGWTYFIFSLAVTIVQMIVLYGSPEVFPVLGTMDAQILLSTGSLYLVGTPVLIFCFKAFKLQTFSVEKKNMSVISMVKAFLMCYALLIITNLLGTLITTFIGVLKGTPVINPLEEVAMNMSMPLLFLVTVVGAPIFEELFFRKFLIDRTVKYGELVSVMISGFMFGLFHGNLSQFPYAFALGVFFAMIYIRTGKIGYTMILHACINFMGSIASSLVVQAVDMEMFTKLASSTSPEEILDTFAMMEGINIGGIAVLLVYEMAVFILVIVGTILWILEAKKFFFKPAEEQIPKGKGFRVSILNGGMIAYIILWGITIIFATI